MKQNGYYVSLRKTTKVDVNDDSHLLPPDLGEVEEFKVSDHPGCPEEWSKDGVFVAVKEGQPLWFDFRANEESALLCSVQRLNPVTGEPSDIAAGLSRDPKQNYMVLPGQKWLDGYSRDGKVYQFVVTAAGEGLAVNETVLPVHMQDSHALGFAFFAPKNPKPRVEYRQTVHHITKGHQSGGYNLSGGTALPRYLGGTSMSSTPIAQNSAQVWAETTSKDILSAGAGADARVEVNAELETGGFSEVCDFDAPPTRDILEEQVEVKKASMGAGGRIGQDIEQDDNTVDYYHEKPIAQLTVYLALPAQFEKIMKGAKRVENKKDEYTHSGKIGGVQVPLI